MEDKKRRTTKTIDLLTSVEKIVELTKDSHLNKEFYRKADKYIRYMSEKLEMTKEEAVMIADSIQSRRIQALSCEYTRHGAQDTLACWQDRCPTPPQDPP